MLDRVLIAIVLSILGWVIWTAFNRLSIKRLAVVAPVDPVLNETKEGTPVVLYFTTPFCEPCRTLQKPALEQLKAELGMQVQVVQIDSTEQPEIADRWGVMSVPTTFILDREHKPHTVNRGVASAETLKKQVQHVLQAHSAA